MAKIRTIKPEFFRHEGLFEAEKEYQMPLRTAFSGLFTCADREGRFRWRPRQLKLDVLPYDEVDFTRVLDALATRGFIVKYEVKGEVYGCIPSWHKHQHINHKESASSLPPLEQGHILPPSKMLTETTIASGKEHVSVTREPREPHASNTDEGATLETPGNARGEMEGKGNGKGSGNGTGIVESGTEGAVSLIFEHWKQVMGHPKAVLDKQRRELINAALKLGYTTEELCEAISGCSYTPHNMGSNERGERYDGLHIILKDANQIDRFRKHFECPPKPQNTAEKRVNENITAARTWLENSNHQQEVPLHGQN